MESYVLELLEKGKRIDGRKFDEFREIRIEENVVQKAEGSASVWLGETHVIAGVKLELGTPYADSPDQGVLIVNAEFTPLASPDFEPGPPGEDAIELARVVDRGIRESECIELEKLCITPGEKVWCIFVDISILNHQGNLLDASALASLVALRNTRIPKLEEDKIIRGEYEGKLPVRYKPINITVAKIGNALLIDPSFEEEKVVESKVSVGVRDDDKICAIQKQGSKEISFEEIDKILDLALEKSREIRKLVK
ncbi:MAG TPA: exosome complex protein Rrp42 [Candidatus Aenigmarchaeota archaeon]|nr:exosome complex protein Rrp42 [Candidatus Aenigmarchaeota archaeon]